MTISPLTNSQAESQELDLTGKAANRSPHEKSFDTWLLVRVSTAAPTAEQAEQKAFDKLNTFLLADTEVSSQAEKINGSELYKPEPQATFTVMNLSELAVLVLLQIEQE